MCDFRLNIKKIRIRSTNEVIEIPNEMPEVSYSEYATSHFPEPGFYHVVATGGFYCYWTGTERLTEYGSYIDSQGELREWGEYEVLEWDAFEQLTVLAHHTIGEDGIERKTLS